LARDITLQTGKWLRTPSLFFGGMSECASANAVGHAYDAATLNELYSSCQAGTRDQLISYVQFVTSTIAVAVFGLLPKS